MRMDFRTSEMKPTKVTAGGEVKIVDAKNFPVTTISAAIVKLKPGGLRELHWHPNADEWQYFISGKGRMTVFAAGGLARTEFTLALHFGDLLFGNFGGGMRLDFTVLGPAVNEASRIAQLCRSLDQRVIVSSAFASASGNRRAELVSLGRYALKGVATPQELFTLDPGA